MQVIPAMDLIGGRCVRLRQGDFARTTTYADDPVAVAQGFAAAGVQRLHMVDLDGARAGSPQHLHVLRAVCAATDLQVDYSGGVRTTTDVEAVFDAGAHYLAVGSAAVNRPDQVIDWMQRSGPERFIIGADVRQGRVATHGWLEESTLTVEGLIDRFVGIGVRQVFCTDIASDGMGAGPALDLYRQLVQRYPSIGIIASGGVATVTDLEQLAAIGCSGAIVGRAIYDGHITLVQLRPWLH